MADELKRVGLKFTNEGVRNFKAELKECTAATKENYSELKLAQSQYDKNTSSTKKLEDRQKYLAKQTDVYKDKVKILNQQLKEMETAENKDETAISNKRAELNQAEATLNKYEKSLEEVNKQLDNGAAKMKEWGGKIQDVGGKMKDIGGTLTTHVTAPLAAIGTVGVQKFAEVDKTMQLTNKTMGNTKQEAELLDKAMKDAASNSTFGMSDAATATLNFARAGLDAEQAAAALAPSMNLAAGEGGNLDTVSAGLVSTINGFHGSFSEASNYADVFASACNNSALDVDSLSHAMSVAAPVFSAAGYKVNDAALYMGVMANNGIEADKAANSLKTGISRLVSPSKQGAEMMEKLGISVTNADGSMKDSATVQKELHEAFGKLSESEQIAAASAIFGKNQMAPWLALINTAPEDVGKLDTSLKNCSGTTDEMSKAMMDGFGGSLEKLKSNMDVAATSLGQALAPTIQKVANFIGDLVTKFNNLSPAQQETIAKIGLVVAAIGPLLVILGTLVGAIGSLITFGPVIIAAIGGVVAPVLGVVAVIGTLVAALVTVVKHWKDIKKAAGDFVKGVKEKWEGFKKATKETVDNTVKKWNQWKKDTGQKISDTAKGAKKKFDEIKKNAGTAFENVKKSASEKLGQARQKAIDAFDKIRTGAADKLGTAKQKATDAFEALRKGAKDKLDQAGKTAGTAFEFIKKSASDKLGQAKQTASNIFDKIKGFAKFSWHLPKLGVKAISGLVNFVKGIIKKVRDAFKFKWSLPKLKLPHPKITGHFSLNPPSVPHFSIRWYKDAYQRAAYYNSPTVRADGRGFGDGHGGEFAVGEKHLRDVIREETYNPVNVTYGDVNINVYSSPGQDVRKLAEEVSRRLATVYERERAVWT